MFPPYLRLCSLALSNQSAFYHCGRHPERIRLAAGSSYRSRSQYSAGHRLPCRHEDKRPRWLKGLGSLPEYAQNAARCFVYHLSSSFPLVVFICFIIPYCQAEILTNFALFRPVLHFFNVRAVVCSQSAFVTLLRCASRRDSPSWANLAPAPLADQSSTFVSTSRMVLGNFAENVRVLHFLNGLQDFVAALGGQKNAAAGSHCW